MSETGVTTGTANFEHRPAPVINQPSVIPPWSITNEGECNAPPEPTALDRVVALAQALLDAGMDIDSLLWRMMRAGE